MPYRFPDLNTAAEDCHMLEALRLVFFRPPGGGGLLGSRTVENNFLVS